MTTVLPFPDVEVEILAYLAGKFGSYRFSTRLPGTFTGIAMRIHRISGRNIRLSHDRAIVDVDTFSTTGEADCSTAARAVQAALLSLAGTATTNGVVQRATTINGPRWLPESNETIVRYGATYEIVIRSK